MPSANFFLVGLRSWLFINRHFERSIILQLKERWRLIFWLTFKIIYFLPSNDDALWFPSSCHRHFKKVYLRLVPVISLCLQWITITKPQKVNNTYGILKVFETLNDSNHLLHDKRFLTQVSKIAMSLLNLYKMNQKGFFCIQINVIFSCIKPKQRGHVIS